MQLGTLADAYALIKKLSPACSAGVLTALACMYVYGGQTFITADEAARAHADLATQITKGFQDLTDRLNLSDAEIRLRDAEDRVAGLQKAIRDRRQEIDTLSGILSDVTGNAATQLRGRIFAAEQEMGSLVIDLEDAVQVRAQATRERNQIDRKLKRQ